MTLPESVETVQNIVHHHLERLLCWRHRQALQSIQRLQVQHPGSGIYNAGRGAPCFQAVYPVQGSSSLQTLCLAVAVTILCVPCKYGAVLLYRLAKGLAALPGGRQLTMSASWRARCRAAWMPPPK